MSQLLDSLCRTRAVLWGNLHYAEQAGGPGKLEISSAGARPACGEAARSLCKSFFPLQSTSEHSPTPSLRAGWIPGSLECCSELSHLLSDKGLLAQACEFSQTPPRAPPCSRAGPAPLGLCWCRPLTWLRVTAHLTHPSAGPQCHPPHPLCTLGPPHQGYVAGAEMEKAPMLHCASPQPPGIFARGPLSARGRFLP